MTWEQISNCDYYEVRLVNTVSTTECYSCADDYIVSCSDQTVNGGTYRVCNECVPRLNIGDGCRV